MKNKRRFLSTTECEQAKLEKQHQEERLLNIGKKKHVQFKETEYNHICCISIDIEAIQQSIDSGFHEIPAGSSSEDIHKLLMS